MKILFIAHGYPPTFGGIENQNYNLATGLKKLTPVTIIANGRGKRFLPFFLPYAFLKSLFLFKKYDACLLGSGVLSPIGRALKFLYPKKKVFSVIHGLDITYVNQKSWLSKVYRYVNLPALKKLDKLFMVGHATIEVAVKEGLDRKKCQFIPNGVDLKKIEATHSRHDLELLFGKKLSGKKLILRVGRFVPHKGTGWFIENIMPRLPEHIIMIAAGSRVGKTSAGTPDDFPRCEKAIIKNHLENRVRLLPSLPQDELNVLLNTADLVVAPNVKTPHTMEGFGLNVIEAGACQRVVIASNLEGLADAIKDGKNGFLVEAGNIKQWTDKINQLINAGEAFNRAFGKRAKKYVLANYSWENICRKYLKAMKKNN